MISLAILANWSYSPDSSLALCCPSLGLLGNAVISFFVCMSQPGKEIGRKKCALRVQLEEDGARRSWMETSLCHVLHWGNKAQIKSIRRR